MRKKRKSILGFAAMAGAAVGLLLLLWQGNSSHREENSASVTGDSSEQSARGDDGNRADSGSDTSGGNDGAQSRAQQSGEDREIDPEGKVALRWIEKETLVERFLSMVKKTDRIRDVVGLARGIADDPEFAQLVRREMEAVMASQEGEERARAILLNLGLVGEEGLERWRLGVTSDSDPQVRAWLLEGVQMLADEELLSEVHQTVITSIQSDVDPKVRQAAVRALPVGMEEGRLMELASQLTVERDPAVRKQLIDCLGVQRSESRRVLESLKSVTYDSLEQKTVRRAALRAIRKLRLAHPELLSEAELEEIEQLCEKLDD